MAQDSSLDEKEVLLDLSDGTGNDYASTPTAASLAVTHGEAAPAVVSAIEDISKTCTALGALDQTRPRLFRRAPDISGPIGAQNIGRSAALTALLLSPSSLWAFPLSLPSVSYSQRSVRAANGPGLN